MLCSAHHDHNDHHDGDNKADADPQLLHNWQISRQFLASLSLSLSVPLPLSVFDKDESY